MNLTTPYSDTTENQSSIKKHAKSFFLASLFLPKKSLKQAHITYGVCRLIDDIADSETFDQTMSLSLLKSVDSYFRDTEAKLPQLIEKKLTPQENTYLLKYKNLELSNPALFDLLEGAISDLTFEQPQTTDELIQYCYKVAGSVGIMMLKVLNVSDFKTAYPFAVDLGIAMQLTNILRDIEEDLTLGRSYIPKTMPDASREENLPLIRKDIFKISETYYKSARIGYRFIPAKQRLAICIAESLYRGIGRKIKKQDYITVNKRIYLNSVEKSIASLMGFAVFCKFLLPFNANHPHKQSLHKSLEPWLFKFKTPDLKI